MKRFILFLLIVICATFTGLSVYSFKTQPITIGSFSFYEPEVLGEERLSQPEKHRIIFTGDIMLARSVELIMRQYGPQYPFSQLPAVPSDAFVVGNFEAAIPMVHVPTPSMQFSFSVEKDHVEGLAAYGFTHVSLANNHSFDFGEDDFMHTMSVLEQADITPFGNPQQFASTTVPLLQVGSTTVALIGVYSVNITPDMEMLSELLTQTEKVSDYQIVYIHWGEEYTQIHTSSQEMLAHQLIDAGADVIIGHHPHVVQDIEAYNNALIFYSLGNFIFDQFFSDDVQKGLMLELSFIDAKPMFTLVPISSIDSRSAPRHMSSYEKDAFLTELSEISAAELEESIRLGVIKN